MDIFRVVSETSGDAGQVALPLLASPHGHSAMLDGVWKLSDYDLFDQRHQIIDNERLVQKSHTVLSKNAVCLIKRS